jgi:hypothetical protein
MSAPRRMRFAVLAAVVTLVATAGAFLAFRPDSGAGLRLRHPARAAAASDDPTLTQPGSVATASAAASAGGSATATSAASSTSAAAGGTVSSSTASSSTATAGTSVATAGSGATPGRSARPGPATTAGQPPPAARAPAPATTPAAAMPTDPVPPGWSMLPKAPIGGRVGHAAVWTGREMVLWGGAPDLDSDPLTDGAAYDPAAGTWRTVPAAPLSPRFGPTALWTGAEMVIFGGTSTDGDILGDGAAWDPATNRWQPLPASPLGPRVGAVVAWAGDRMVVWGGATVPPPDNPDAPTQMLTDGAAYVPATNSWVPVPAAPIPARSGAESVWTGSRLIVTGGYHEGDDDDRTDGAALDPASGAWSPIAARPAPGSCGETVPCDGVWTGTMALFPAEGLAYEAAADRWSTVSPYPAADASVLADPAVWTGTRLLTWGSPADPSVDSGDPAAPGATATDDTGAGGSDGTNAGDAPLAPAVGGLYDPATGRWGAVAGGPLATRLMQSAVWTGHELLIWGGTAGDTALADGASYRP